MSHQATNWAIQQRGLAPATKIVLWHLCDRYHPDNGCFPSQETLADDCEMSRRSVNDHLSRLEEAGLIRRVRQIDQRTKRQKSTRYILGFEDDFALYADNPSANFAHGSKEEQKTDPSANSAHGAVCKSASEPCANSRRTRVQNLHTNSVREPVKEPCAVPALKSDFDFDEFLGSFTEAYPRPGDPDATETELRLAIEAGIAPEHILAAARAYAVEQAGNAPRYVAFSENWLRQRRWERHTPGRAVDEAAVLAQRAEAVKDRKPWVVNTLSAHKARELVERGLVTPEECRAAGVQL